MGCFYGLKINAGNLSTGVSKWLLQILKFSFYNTNFQIQSLTFAVQNLLSIMARVCQVTGKVPVRGHKVSHSNIKTKRRFLPNLQKKRFYLAEEDKWITLKLTTDAIRTINKRGLFTVVKELRAQGQHI